jgi:SAM-dependent methyltransferase
MKDEMIDTLADLEEDNWWVEGRKKVVYDIIKKYAKQSNGELRILDAGCGPGGTTSFFSEFGQLYGTDFSTQALKHAIGKNLQNVFKSDLTALPLQSEKFDIIIALDVIEHIENDLGVLKELKRILLQDGVLIITVPAFQFLWSEHDLAVSHVRRYSISSLTRILKESNFTISRISYFISFFFPFVVIYRILKKPNTKRKNPRPNAVKFPKNINIILKKLAFLENEILKMMNLPFGVSIVCVAKKS